MRTHLRSCCQRWPLAVAALVCSLALAIGAPPSIAHVSPAGCTGNSLLLAISRDGDITYEVGNAIAYSVTIAVPPAAGPIRPCQVTNIQASFTRPDGLVVNLPVVASLIPGQFVIFTGDTVEGLTYEIPMLPKGSSTLTSVGASVSASGTAHTGPQDGSVEASHSLSTDIAQTLASLLGAGRPAAVAVSPFLRVRLDAALPGTRTPSQAPVTMASRMTSAVTQPLNLYRWIGSPLPDRRDGGRG